MLKKNEHDIVKIKKYRIKNLKDLLIYSKRVMFLKSKGWYRNITGGMTDSHCMRVISKERLVKMSEDEFLVIK